MSLPSRVAFLLLLCAGTAPALPLQSRVLPSRPGQSDAVPSAVREHVVATLDDIPTSTVDPLIAAVPTRAAVYLTDAGQRLHLDNGLVRRSFLLSPNAATFSLLELSAQRELVRAVRPEARITLDGQDYAVGGLVGQPNHAFLREAWLDELKAAPTAFHYVGHEVGAPRERLPWKRVRHHAADAVWPPNGVSLRLDFASPAGTDQGVHRDVRVSVHYELYDGIPVMAKWISVHNGGATPITVDSFVSEVLAVVEDESWVETRNGVPYPAPESLHLETDYAFGGMTAANASHRAVHWRADPQYASQVNYQRVTPCLLEVGPELGPAVAVPAGESFESFCAFELVHDSSERERRGLTQRRMYRTLAPWVTENPLMHHMRVADRAEVVRAIDEAAAVGFEMLILSFGSGFNIETDDPEVVAGWAEVAALAGAKGVEIGGYSLLASRSISPEHDVLMPEGKRPTFGNSPCLGSAWGQAYFETLRSFFERTGFNLLEHDGNYPGDECLSQSHPGHAGAEDSRWMQWRRITDFYAWCRGRGISLNVPDYYYLSGSTKSGMGYREVNWSLPRAEQVIHTRQNIYDGTWTKTPSMGWMFVPLTEYHGGGEAATIEPLDAHLEHYGRMLQSNLAMGVQACFRGPRLFDTERTQALLSEQVAWFLEHREILESDVIHGRRPDGRRVDWMLHVDPYPSAPDSPRGMLVAFNPLETAATETLDVDLYYTGLSESALVSVNGGTDEQRILGRDHHVQLSLSIPAGGMSWVSFR